MNIVNKKSNMAAFKELYCGEVFIDKHFNYCMKIELNHNKNMVYLFDGALGYADDEELFEKVKCELIVE